MTAGREAEYAAALAEWFHRELGDRCNRHDSNVKPACENWADQFLRTGPVLAALPDTKATREATALREAADLVNAERTAHLIASTRAPAAGALFRVEQALIARADRIDNPGGTP